MCKRYVGSNNTTINCLVLLADIFQGANEQASQISGDLAPNPVSSVDLFAGAIIPGLILVMFYGIWIFFYSVLFPKSFPKKIANKKVLEISLRP